MLSSDYIVVIILIWTRASCNNAAYFHSGAAVRSMIGIGQIEGHIVAVAHTINHYALDTLRSEYVISRKFERIIFRKVEV